VSTDPGQCYASLANVPLGAPVASDNSGSVSITSNAPAQFPIGTNTVTWTATDPSGNTNSCVQLVIVRLLPASVGASRSLGHNLSLSFGVIPHLACRIEASTNLLDWETLTNYPDPVGLVEYDDLCASNFPQRFYRAVWAP